MQKACSLPSSTATLQAIALWPFHLSLVLLAEREHKQPEGRNALRAVLVPPLCVQNLINFEIRKGFGDHLPHPRCENRGPGHCKDTVWQGASEEIRARQQVLYFISDALLEQLVDVWSSSFILSSSAMEFQRSHITLLKSRMGIPALPLPRSHYTGYFQRDLFVCFEGKTDTFEITVVLGPDKMANNSGLNQH